MPYVDSGMGFPVWEPDPAPPATWGATTPTGAIDKSTPGGGGQAVDPNAALIAQMQAQQAAQQQQAREGASAFLTNVLSQYGLGSLAGDVNSLVQQWGTNTDVISLKLKDTQAYQTRFAGLIALQKKGVTDVANEGQYIQLESQYRQAFRENGLQDYLGAAGSTNEQQKIADIVGNYSLSVSEVRDRIADSQRVVANTPQEVKDAFFNYYGVTAADLVGYDLDPTRTADLVNREANAAIVGGIGAQHQLGLGLHAAEQIANQAGTSDINQGQLDQTLTQAQTVRDTTRRLAQIENSDLSDDESALATFGVDSAAQQRIKTLQSRERARFSGSGAVVRGTLNQNSGA